MVLHQDTDGCLSSSDGVKNFHRAYVQSAYVRRAIDIILISAWELMGTLFVLSLGGSQCVCVCVCVCVSGWVGVTM